MKMSHSKTELYNQCGAKYKYKYIDKLEPNKTFTPLLFGAAVDKALNYVLIRTKRKHTVYIETAIAIFQKNMDKWGGKNELVYFKNEMPEGIEDLSDVEKQDAVWAHLCEVGKDMLITYQNEILPLFKEILSVQTRREIPNEEGDVLVLITDFTARLQDGRVVTFDNKTTTDIKKSYPKTAVAKSQQLAIYTEFEESRLAGYIALQKKRKDGKIVWDVIVDTVPEKQVEAAFEKVDNALRAIKREEFPKNEKSCFSFGRKCDYWNICKNQNSKGLIKK